MGRFLEAIERTALIGTERAFIDEREAPPALRPLLEKIIQSEGSKESRFLKIVACFYQYVGAGLLPASGDVTIGVAHEDETRKLLPESLASLLHRCVAENETVVLQGAIQRCLDHGFVSSHALIPALLDLGVSQKRDEELVALLRTFVGRRGQWLSQFNTPWFALYFGGDERLWHDGALPLRIRSLKRIRQRDRQRGLDLLSAAWGGEHYRARVEFLKALSSTVALDDLPFLQKCLEDERKEVQREALRLIACLPSTAGVTDALLHAFAEVLASPAPDGIPVSIEDLLKRPLSLAAMGIEGVSFTVHELLAIAPPREVAEKLGMRIEELIEQLLAPESACGGALLEAIVLHRDRLAARHAISAGLVRPGEITRPLVHLFSPEEALELLSSLRQYPYEFVHFASHLPVRWSRELTNECVERMRTFPRAFPDHAWFGTLVLCGDSEALEQMVSRALGDPTSPWSVTQLS